MGSVKVVHNGRVVVVVPGPVAPVVTDATALANATALTGTAADDGTSIEVRRAVVTKLSSEGARVWFVAHDAAELERLLAAGVVSGGCVIDPWDRAALSGAFDQAAGLTGEIHGLFVEAVATTSMTPLVDLDDESIVDGFGRSLAWLVTVARDGARRLADGGAMCLVVSPLGTRPHAGHLRENVGSAAAIALAKTVALEVADRRVSVTALCPGSARSKVPVLLGPPLWNDQIGEMESPAASEVASLASFLLSAEAAFCTGGVFTMDGSRES